MLSADIRGQPAARQQEAREAAGQGRQLEAEAAAKPVAHAGAGECSAQTFALPSGLYLHSQGAHDDVVRHLQGCRRAPNANGKLMPEWEDMSAVACAVQNLHMMATSMGLAGMSHSAHCIYCARDFSWRLVTRHGSLHTAIRHNPRVGI